MYKAEKRFMAGKLYVRESESITDDDMEELEPVKGARDGSMVLFQWL